MARVLAVIITAAGLILGACGGDDDTASTDSTARPPASASEVPAGDEPDSLDPELEARARVSDTVDMDSLDPELEARAREWVEVNLPPDAPDPEYVIWSLASQCGDEVTVDEFLIRLSMESGIDPGLTKWRAVCPGKVADAGF